MGEPKELGLTIVVDGTPESKVYPDSKRVEEVIKDLLLPGEKERWAEFVLSDREKELNPVLSLKENGVKDGDTLSLTKKHGGGGSGRNR